MCQQRQRHHRCLSESVCVCRPITVSVFCCTYTVKSHVLCGVRLYLNSITAWHCLYGIGLYIKWLLGCYSDSCYRFWDQLSIVVRRLYSPCFPFARYDHVKSVQSIIKFRGETLTRQEKKSTILIFNDSKFHKNTALKMSYFFNWVNLGSNYYVRLSEKLLYVCMYTLSYCIICMTMKSTLHLRVDLKEKSCLCSCRLFVHHFYQWLNMSKVCLRWRGAPWPWLFQLGL